VGFIFLIMAIGMAVGTRVYQLAVFSTAVLSMFMVMLSKLNMFSKEITERMLRVQLPAGRDHEEVFEETFRKYLDEYRVVSIETVRAGVLQEIVYSVVLKKTTTPNDLLEAVRKVNDNQKVTLVIGQQDLDL
jgi:uncharacterized membrane protein YhiD involved in acid resistance